MFSIPSSFFSPRTSSLVKLQGNDTLCFNFKWGAGDETTDIFTCFLVNYAKCFGGVTPVFVAFGVNSVRACVFAIWSEIFFSKNFGTFVYLTTKSFFTSIFDILFSNFLGTTSLFYWTVSCCGWVRE